jgi:hypothetical protein
VEIIGEDAPTLEKGSMDIAETSKVKELIFSKEAILIEKVTGIKPVHSKLGPAFKGQAKAVVAALSAISPEKALENMSADGLELEVEGERITLPADFIEMEKRLTLDGKAVDTIQLGNTLIVLEI